MRDTYRLLILWLWLLSGRVDAQPSPADTLWHAWLHRQEQAWHGWQQLAFTLEMHQEIDAPSGMRHLHLVAEIHVTPGRHARQIRRLEVDGRPLPAEHYPRVLRPVPPWLDRLLNHWPPFDLLRALRPQALLSDTVDQVPCWRLELLPPGPHPIERATLWFARDSLRLVQSRLLLRHPHVPVPVLLHTRFRQVAGRDLPAYRRLSWLHHVRRRMRRYTLLITQELFYRNYRIKTSGIP